MNKRNIVINSSLLFVIAFLLQTTFHELGHCVAAVAMHAKDVRLHHNYANYDGNGMPVNNIMVIAAAGPLVSLFIGALFHFICSFYSKRNIGFLFMLYLSAFGYLCFGGYLMIAPFFENGDTGYIFHQLGSPLWITIAAALLGVGFILLMSKYLGKYFAEMGNAEMLEDKQQQKAFSDVLIKYPLYIGIVASTLLNLPVMAFVSLMYPLFNPLNMFWIYGYVMDTNYSTENANKEFYRLEKLQPVLIVAFVLFVISNRLLVYGIHF